MVSLKRRFEDHNRKKKIKVLITSDPEKLAYCGQKALIPAFVRATKMPAYAGLLKAKNVDYSRIKSVESFIKKVPIFSKEDIFTDFDVSTLCVEGNFSSMKLATSDCSSGLCSFTINTEYNERMIRESMDTFFEYLFKTDQRKTFVVSCIPMGMKIPTSLPLAETSVRSDIALSIIKKFSHHFDQTLIVGVPSFLKKLIEEGIEIGINFKQKNVSLIFTEDWFSESFRKYMEELIGVDCKDPDDGLICSTRGLSELGLNLFHETFETINLRKRIQYDSKMMKKVFGKKFKACPTLYQYYPTRLFLETTKNQDLVYSILDRHFLTPLMRYNSKDAGYVFSYKEMKEILQSESCSELIPELKLPLVAIKGRSQRHLMVKGKPVSSEEIQQGLYSFPEAASSTTGFFKLSNIDDSLKEGQIEIQLKKGVNNNKNTKKLLTKALLACCDVDLKVVLYRYQDFPYGMELNYEKRYVSV